MSKLRGLKHFLLSQGLNKMSLVFRRYKDAHEQGSLGNHVIRESRFSHTVLESRPSSPHTAQVLMHFEPGKKMNPTLCSQKDPDIHH